MATWPKLRIHVGRLLQRDSIADLKRRLPGDDVVQLDEVVEAKDLRITTAQIPDGSAVGVSASVTGTMRGVEAALDISASWEGECRRCLDPVSAPIEISTSVSFLEEAGGGAHDADEIEAYPLDGDWIDLGEVVREELMLALPLSPLCAEDCSGADPTRFPTGDEEDAEGDAEEEPAIDPRWAGLSALTFDED